MRIGVVVPMSLSDGPGQMPTWPQVRGDQPGEAGSAGDLHRISAPGSAGEAGRDHRRGQRRRAHPWAGAGRYDPEYEAFGYPTGHRVGRFEEAIAIIGPLLRGERVTLAGSYCQVRDAVVRPPPDRPIPILVAAKGGRMLRLTVRYAEAWNMAWFGLPDELLHRRLAELNAALEAEGRDPATLRRTVGMEVQDPQAVDSGEDFDLGRWLLGGQHATCQQWPLPCCHADHAEPGRSPGGDCPQRRCLG